MNRELTKQDDELIEAFKDWLEDQGVIEFDLDELEDNWEQFKLHYNRTKS